MTRLSELVHDPSRGWDSVAAVVRPPVVGHYNIAADCLGHPADAAALIVADASSTRTVSFGELDDQSARMATVLIGLGVAPGDRVAIRLSQSLEMAVAVLGVLRAAAVVVPISTMLGDDAVRHRLDDSGARVLICTGGDEELTAALEAGALPVTTHEVTGHVQLSDALWDARRAETVSTDGETPGVLLYTSGTEGKSKGVLHGHRVIPGHYTLGFAFDGVRPDDVAYSPVDWAWGGGLLLGLLAPLAYGMPVVAFRQPGFDPGRVLELMRATGVTVGLFPPTVLRMLRAALDGRRADGLRLRCLISGAESVEADLIPWAKDALGATVNNAYGQTEANALVGHSASLGPLDPAALGRPYPGRRIAVLGEDLRPVSPGDAGQLAVDATDPVCMLRYWRQPEATADKVRNGWLLTGDTVHADDEGTLHFHGRSDDIIKASGYRIGPAEVEAALLRHPLVLDCAVVGVPDAVRGGAVAAFVRLAQNPPATSEIGNLVKALQLEVRTHVGAHAYPRRIDFVDELPRTPTGKVDRRLLRDLASSARSERAHD
jgi:acetyl-CoA synthetase